MKTTVLLALLVAVLSLPPAPTIAQGTVPPPGCAYQETRELGVGAELSISHAQHHLA